MLRVCLARVVALFRRSRGGDLDEESARWVFDVLRVAPAIGRAFEARDEDESSPSVAVLSHGLWQRAFGGAPDAIGQAVRVGGDVLTIVGVMPAGVALPRRAEMWAPIPLGAPIYRSRDAHFLRPIGRLRPDVVLAQAQEDADVIARRLERKYPSSNDGWRLRLEPLRDVLLGPGGGRGRGVAGRRRRSGARRGRPGQCAAPVGNRGRHDGARLRARALRHRRADLRPVAGAADRGPLREGGARSGPPGQREPPSPPGGAQPRGGGDRREPGPRHRVRPLDQELREHARGRAGLQHGSRAGAAARRPGIVRSGVPARVLSAGRHRHGATPRGGRGRTGVGAAAGAAIQRRVLPRGRPATRVRRPAGGRQLPARDARLLSGHGDSAAPRAAPDRE